MYNMDWQITIERDGKRLQLALLDSCEIHKSVDLLADTCTIKLPGYAQNKVITVSRTDTTRAEQKIKRGDKVIVKFGYNGQLRTEFEGYVLNITTDDADLVLNCEDDLFLMRKAVSNRQFKNTQVKAIAEYLVQQVGASLEVRCSLTVGYDKFVINQATAYDVLKKIQEELKANVYLRDGALHIHPPYTERHGRVRYSFQKNIEGSSLKYKTAEDKKVQVVVEGVGRDGKKVEVESGTTGGDKITLKGSGMSQAAMKALADAEWKRNVFNGYEGDVTSWLIPYAEPGYSAEISDEDFEYKNGWYFVKSVTTTFDSGGGARKVQLGIKVS